MKNNLKHKNFCVEASTLPIYQQQCITCREHTAQDNKNGALCKDVGKRIGHD